MESQLVEKSILEVLVNKFGCEFKLRSGGRHFKFESEDYDFSFPASFCYLSSEQSLKTKIQKWLKVHEENIKPNGHYQFHPERGMDINP